MMENVVHVPRYETVLGPCSRTKVNGVGQQIPTIEATVDRRELELELELELFPHLVLHIQWIQVPIGMDHDDDGRRKWGISTTRAALSLSAKHHCPPPSLPTVLQQRRSPSQNPSPVSRRPSPAQLPQSEGRDHVMM